MKVKTILSIFLLFALSIVSAFIGFFISEQLKDEAYLDGHWVDYAIADGASLMEDTQSETEYLDEESWLKTRVVKNAFDCGSIECSNATAEFSELVQKAKAIQNREQAKHGDYGCEFFEHYYFGHGNGGEEIKNLKVRVVNDSIVHITWDFDSPSTYVDSMLLVFHMLGHKIDDVRFDGMSLKNDAQKMVAVDDCIF